MTQQQNSSNTSGNQPYAMQSGSSQSNTSSDSNLNQVEQAYASSDASAQAGTNAAQAQSTIQQQPASAASPQGSATQQQPASSASPQESMSQAMSSETGLEYTADVIRQEKLKTKNQKATDSLVDRMYWQHEESLSKSIKVSDKGELENYDDTPGFGNDKPGL